MPRRCLPPLCVQVAGGEHVGIVGRTGSGKSSLFALLLRFVEPCAGSVTIDGRDTRALGLQTLRKGVCLIPQDPVLFSASVRENLDPEGSSSDSALWTALERVTLKATVSGFEKGLEAELQPGGSNLSQGQRQLLALARALLARPQVRTLLLVRVSCMVGRARAAEACSCFWLTIGTFRHVLAYLWQRKLPCASTRDS